MTDVYEHHLPGIDSWVATTTLLCSKGDNSEEIPGLRVVEIGRLLLSVDYVPHVKGTSRVTLGNNDKDNGFKYKNKNNDKEYFLFAQSVKDYISILLWS